ncbi:leucine-rich repeat protein [Flammeovirga aprica]|uniref:Leucine-rich repeat protein n=1 Tax=Flammeovirga aprica JL-4 TaxID=694437 RepID=A0A7X9RV89_9BACT|nr:leucine-rich repeat protein [Flammeovirga aprica]NME69345.1 leucine-rich repeat protein [Flammeovirga aprica JL-4]
MKFTIYTSSVCFLIQLLSILQLSAQDDLTLTDDMVVVENGVITYARYPFDEYHNIIIPDTLDGQLITGINDNYQGVFSNIELESVQLPSQLVHIGPYTFSGNNLKAIDLPNSLRYIGEYAFSDNDGFEMILPDLSSIDNFIDWYGNESFSYQGGETISSLKGWIRFVAQFSHTLTKEDTQVDEKGYITSVTYNFTSFDIIIPDFINGIEIKGIACGETDNFRSRKIRTLHLPKKLDYLEPSAFAYNKLTHITLPDSLKRVSTSAFFNNSIQTIDFNETLEVIGEKSFMGNSISEIEIPSNIKKIEERAFSSNLISKLTFSDNEIDISGKYIFRYNQLKDITIPGSIRHIGNYTFSNNNISTLTLNEGLQVIGHEAFSFNELSEVTLPKSIERIERKAFDYNTLKSFKLPIITSDPSFICWGENYEYYNGQTISDFSEIIVKSSWYTLQDKDVEVRNDSLINVLKRDGIQNIIIPEQLNGQNIKTLAKDPFNEDAFLFERSSMLRVQLPSTLEDIGDDAFKHNRIIEITFPEKLHRIGNSAFQGNQLTALILHDNITDLREAAFDYNPIQTVRLPQNIKTIPNDLFRSNRLSEVVIPNSVEYIGDYAFFNNGLTDITLQENVIEIGNNAFSHNEIRKIHFPEKLEIIRGEAFSSNYISTIELTKKVWKVEKGAFSRNDNLISFSLPDFSENSDFVSWVTYSDSYYNHLSVIDGNVPVTSFYSGYEAQFMDTLTAENCVVENGVIISTTLENKIGIYIPDTIDGQKITGLGDELFSFKSITKLILPDALKSIGYKTLAGCKLSNFNFPSGLEYIDNEAFIWSDMDTITLPNQLHHIGESAFERVYYSQLNLPQSLEYIGSNAFTNDSISHFILPENNSPDFYRWLNANNNYSDYYYETDTEVYTNRGYKAIFAHTLTDEDVTMKDGLIVECFYDFELTNILIPETLQGQKVIGIEDGKEDNGVFSNKGITRVFLNDSIEYIGDFALSDNEINGITFPENLIHLGKGALSDNEIHTLREFPTGLKFIGRGCFTEISNRYFDLPYDFQSPVIWYDDKGNTYNNGATVTDLYSYYTTDKDYKENNLDEIITDIESLEKSILVYPTKFSHQITVELSSNIKYNVAVFDIQGNNVLSHENNFGKINIDLNIPKGIYLVNITGDGFKKSFKVIKE